jgi:hypothetical protein
MSQTRGSRTAVTEVKCGSCNSKILETPSTHDENSVECDCCSKWYHTGCAKISEAVYAAIADSDVTWYCPPCKGGASKLKTLLVGLETEQQKLRQDLTSLKNKVNSSEKKILTKVSEEIDQKISTKFTTSKANILVELSNDIEDKIDARINIKVQQMITNKEFPQLPQPADPPIQGLNESPNTARTRIMNVVNETLTETADQQARKLNLMIFNLPEATDPEQESAQLKTLIETKMSCTEEEIIIKEITRMGRVRDDDKPRFVRLKLETLAMKRKILSSATKLRQLPSTDIYAKVYIKPDLTKKQQQESKNLYEALKTKRLQDQANHYVISKGKIIIKPPTLELAIPEPPAPEQPAPEQQ